MTRSLTPGLLTAGPAVLVAVLAWGLVAVLAWRLLATWQEVPWWWAWLPAGCAGAGVATWWRLTRQTVDGLRTAWLTAHRAAVAFAAGLVVDGHPAPLELGVYALGTVPLALVLGTLGVASWDAWCRLVAGMERRRLVAERAAAETARQQEAQRQLEEARSRLRRAAALRDEAAKRLEEHQRSWTWAVPTVDAEAVAPLGSPFPSTPRVIPRAAPDPVDLV